MPRTVLALLVPSLLAACGASTSTSVPPVCVPIATCTSRGYQCGAFTDSCGAPQVCGTCGEGTSCTQAGGAPGYCQYAGSLPPAGNPDGACTRALPAAALPADTSAPTTVVGTGTAASCTYAPLAAAVATGGVITFDCGAEPVTIPITATLALRTDRNTVIDGGGKVTLDGDHAVRILSWNSGGWQTNPNVLTLQHLVLANGRTTPVERIPTGRPEPCSQGWLDGQGGALFMRDGELRAVDVTFVNNQAALLGPDTGGGAVYLLGARPATVSRCSFLDNRGSNAGGLGGLFATLNVYDSLFDGNQATGYGANDVDSTPGHTQCSYKNGDVYQIGSGGNGAAVYSDGVDMDVSLCGTQIRDNHAGAFGAAIFFTSNDQSRKGTLSIRDSWFHGNVQDNDYWQWMPGISTNASTPAPVDSTIVR
jgi:hypothetical protein